MRIDYKALNKRTIKEKIFPILVEEKLLNELCGF
jgi:hypothetical protein